MSRTIGYIRTALTITAIIVALVIAFYIDQQQAPTHSAPPPPPTTSTTSPSPTPGKDNTEQPPRPRQPTARVFSVPDADTLMVRHPDGSEDRLRMHGIDAPELHQERGREAQRFMQRLCQGRDVIIEEVEIDQYQRVIARVWLAKPPKAGEPNPSLNVRLVRAGYAWHYRRHARGDRELAAAEEAAKAERAGLWADLNPTPPWRWRHENPR